MSDVFTNENEFMAVDDKRYIVLIIYDIVDNKSRNKMVKCLEGFGTRVQKSAFEAYLNKKRYEKLVYKASKIVNTEEDSLRIYLLANHTSVRSWGKGHTHVEDIIIF
ncbi:CRISPR-associated endonuclease Cas2 [Pectinatus brassicae]|uniref:CRISPR-associated endoribonuclease Cas2 n=1 Tax=Pectinatus brassicae TaxID=862415 RepID=A0A840URN8_9FIRM|nr:CRISPR-associated endonuclease Cas2 [Pectinatus brassicae]MBB5335494.1 CRISPR-associated protein Cas2 [Pectinatus brassicae]